MAIVLFPRKQNLITGVGIGIGCAMFGRALIAGRLNGNDGADAIAPLVGGASLLFGLWAAVTCAFALWRPAPSFLADDEGFSVMGKSKRPWSDFQGVQVRTLRIWWIPTTKWVEVKVGKGKVFARKIQIRWTHLNGPAGEMADEIRNAAGASAARALLARHQKPVDKDIDAAKNKVFDDLFAAPRTEEPAARPTPARSHRAPRPVPAMRKATDSFDQGPIVSHRSLRERIMG